MLLKPGLLILLPKVLLPQEPLQALHDEGAPSGSKVVPMLKPPSTTLHMHNSFAALHSLSEDPSAQPSGGDAEYSACEAVTMNALTAVPAEPDIAQTDAPATEIPTTSAQMDTVIVTPVSTAPSEEPDQSGTLFSGIGLHFLE